MTPSATTVAAAAAASTVRTWIVQQTARGLSPATIRRREWAVRHLARHGVDVLTATVDDIELAMVALPSAASRRCLVSDLRAFYRFARRRGLRDDDPTELIETPRIPARLPSPIPLDDLERAIDTADPITRLMILLGAYAGLRVSEIAALHTDDVQIDEHHDPDGTVVRTGTVTVRNGKGGKDRVVPLHPRLADALAELPGRGPIFGITGHSVSDRIRRQFVACGITHRPHDLRHTFATVAARVADGNLSIVAELMGHANPVTTRRYAAWTPPTAKIVAAMFTTPAA